MRETHRAREQPLHPLLQPPAVAAQLRLPTGRKSPWPSSLKPPRSKTKHATMPTHPSTCLTPCPCSTTCPASTRVCGGSGDRCRADASTASRRAGADGTLSRDLRRNTFRYVKSLDALIPTSKRSRPVHAPRSASRCFRSRRRKPDLVSGFRHTPRTLPAAPETMGVGFGSSLCEPAAPNQSGRGNGTRMAGPTPNRSVRPPLAAERQRTHAASIRFTAAQAGG